MSTTVSVKTGVVSLHPPATALRSAEGMLGEVVELRVQDLWRLDGDSRWRMIICVRGEIWVKQEHDLRD